MKESKAGQQVHKGYWSVCCFGVCVKCSQYNAIGGWLGGAWCLCPEAPVLNTGMKLLRLESQLGL